MKAYFGSTRTRSVLALLASGAAAFTMALPANAAPSSSAQSSSDMSAAFLRSSTPKIVYLDVNTGRVSSVRRVSAANPAISSYAGPCASGDAVYDPQVPYNQFCFRGTAGTSVGPWDHRVGYRSFRYTVSACWTQACGPRIGPNSSATFGGGAVSTGTSFHIY